ncbi:MAG: DNA-binding protein [Candidatus Bathyarchaeota archaeon]
MSEDEELEYIKRKRLLEMQKHLLQEKVAEAQKEKAKVEVLKEKDPKETLKAVFADDAWQVWNLAEQQYPQVINEVVKALVNLVETGQLREKISGGQLYWLFNQLGIRVRIETKIRILEHGQLKTIADKLREK